MSEEVKQLVTDFCRSPEISTQMPGVKDYKSVKQSDGERVHVQKRLLLKNHNEIHQCFKTKYPFVKIGITAFVELIPPECQPAGAAGTHTVCVCSVHENMNLMLKSNFNI